MGRATLYSEIREYWSYLSVAQLKRPVDPRLHASVRAMLKNLGWSAGNFTSYYSTKKHVCLKAIVICCENLQIWNKKNNGQPVE